MVRLSSLYLYLYLLQQLQQLWLSYSHLNVAAPNFTAVDWGDACVDWEKRTRDSCGCITCIMKWIRSFVLDAASVTPIWVSFSKEILRVEGDRELNDDAKGLDADCVRSLQLMNVVLPLDYFVTAVVVLVITGGVASNSIRSREVIYRQWHSNLVDLRLLVCCCCTSGDADGHAMKMKMIRLKQSNSVRRFHCWSITSCWSFSFFSGWETGRDILDDLSWNFKVDVQRRSTNK